MQTAMWHQGADTHPTLERPPPSPRAKLRVLARERRREAQRLNEALDQNRLLLTRTPRLRLACMTNAAEEVALHWPRAELVAAAMLGSTRHSEASLRIGRWLLSEACAMAEPAAGPLISVAVPAVLMQTDLAAEVQAALTQAGLPAARLELRLPEAALLTQSTELLLALSALRDQGVALALDDFGMRIGSTAMLRNLPLTTVVLDPCLTYDLAPDSEDAGFARALIGMARALRLRVVGRAIDSPERLETLRDWGVDEGSGRCCRAFAGVEQAA